MVQVQSAQLAISVLELANAARTSKPGHLRTYSISESTLNPQARLLLLRGGKFHKI